MRSGGQGLLLFLRSWPTWKPRREPPAVWRWAGFTIIYEKQWAGFTIIFEKLAHVAAKEGAAKEEAASCLEVGRVYNIL